MTIRSYKAWKIKDFKEYYNKNHQGKTIGQIKKEDQKFYFAIYRREYLKGIFPRKKRFWKNFSLDDFKNYYEENYKGKNRFEIAKKDNGFYEIIRKKGFLAEVFSPGKTSSGLNGPYSYYSLKDFKNFYKENYSDMTRTQVKKENRKFYEAVLYRGISDKVLVQKNKSGKKSLESTINK